MAEQVKQGAAVEVDENYLDEGLGTDDEFDSSVTSISSSVLDYTYLNGRRYHSPRFKQGEYFMPNDEQEQDRLDLYHHIFQLLIGGKLYISPLENPQKVLDVGTGTGIWAIDFADENPQAEVTGTDLSPIQPNFVPHNVKFEVDDMEEPWTFHKNYFDFVHFRALCGCFRDWDEVLKKAYDHIKPGGWIECQEYCCEVFHSDGKPVTKGTPFGLYAIATAEAGHNAGRELVIAKTLKSRLQKIGFKNVTEEKHVWPFGSWPKDKHLKELGKYARVGMLDGLEAYSLGLLTRFLNWKPGQVKDLCENSKADLSNKSENRYYTLGYFVCGRKPEN